MDVENGMIASSSDRNVSSSTLMGPQKQNIIYSKCRYVVEIFKWFPVIFIISVLTWGWYAYVIQLCIFTMESVILKVFCLIIFHILYILTFWAYMQTIFKPPGTVPKEFWLTRGDVERLMKETTDDARNKIFDDLVRDRNLPVECRNFSGSIRVCEKCNLVKPDRAHHCSVCNACILKMDHHCPWVNNCVSFTNYKFFVMFLGYAFALCLFSALTSLEYFLKFWKNELKSWGKFHILFLFFVSVMFAISLISLFGYHIYLVLLNRSTLESFRFPVFATGPDKNAYNLGKRKNWCQIFGDSKLQWILPIASTSIGDGIIYPKSNKSPNSGQPTQDRPGQSHHGQQYNSIENSNADLESGISEQPIKLSSQQSQANFYNSCPLPGETNPGSPSSGPTPTTLNNGDFVPTMAIQQQC